MTLKIAIVGAGVAGSALHRLLTLGKAKPGIRVDLYSTQENQPCGIHPCAWMTHTPDLCTVMDRLHLDGGRYILRQFTRMDFDGFPIRCDLATIHKPRLLRDLRGKAAIRYDPVEMDSYDVVADCTGAARALLPPAQDDLVTPTLQYRVRRESPFSANLVPSIRFVKIGYAWSFPLDCNHLHVGVGSLAEPLVPALTRSGLLGQKDSVICQCRSSVRVGTPHHMHPLRWKNVWGVGESIGTVSPLVGDGIVPSMQCAAIFADHLQQETLDQYPEHVLNEYSWMASERSVIDRMILHEGRLHLRDLLLMRSHARRFGFQLGAKWILSWMHGKRDTEGYA
jgi:flavin-dependent dehydrogenase